MFIRGLRFNRVALALVLSFVAVSSAFAGQDGPKNIILMVGDGMGPEQIKAAGLYGFGKAGSLSFESMPVKGEVVTTALPYKNGNTVTDSAAAATAMATGHKAMGGVLSVDKSDKPLPTVLEYYQSKGKRTGLVTTSYLCDATPAAFAAHAGERGMLSDIAKQLLNSKVDVLFGGGSEKDSDGMTPVAASAAGYETAVDRKGMQAMKAAKDKRFVGLFSHGRMPFEYKYATKVEKSYDEIPHLNEMALKAMELLDNDQGFFVMIEGGNIDKAGHKNDLPGNIHETLEFDNTVRAVLKWAADRKDTLVIVLADHETGGLSVVKDNGKAQLPAVKWTSEGHTGINIKFFADGPGSEKIKDLIDNTEVYHILKGDYTPSAAQPASNPAAGKPAAQPTEDKPASKPAEALTPAA